MWRVGGGFILASTFLTFAGVSQEHQVTLSEGARGMRDAFGAANLDRQLLGGFLEALAGLVMIPALVFLSRAIGQRTEVGRWASTTALAAGLISQAITFATGFAAGAAAFYGAKHGANLQTAYMVNNVRNFGYFLAVLMLAGQAFGLGIAALTEGRFRKWVGVGGIVTGVVIVASVAGALQNLVNVGAMAQIIWLVGVGVTLILAANKVAPQGPRT
jgi:hypothetical protein